MSEHKFVERWDARMCRECGEEHEDRDAGVPHGYIRLHQELKAERDELQRRIDAVMALIEHQFDQGDPIDVRAFRNGYNICLREVRALLAPKQDARFTVDNYCRAWRVMEGQQIIVEFFAWYPDAEKLARECCDRLNNGARDE